jgi:translocon-associated protein subunit beta
LHFLIPSFLLQGSYVSLGVARTPTDWRNISIVLVLLGAVVGGQFIMKKASSASTNRKRQRALQELEKDE